MSPLEAREKISLLKRKRRRERFDLNVNVVYTGEIYNKGEDIPCRVVQKENSITSTGKTAFIDLITNTGSNGQAHFDNSYATLNIIDDTGGGYTQIGPTGTNFPTPDNSPGSRIRFEFWDTSTNSYNIDTVELHNGDPSNSPLRDSGGSSGEPRIKFNTITGVNESKGSDQNVKHYLEIELYSTDNDFQSAGFKEMLDCFNGQASHYDAGTTLISKTSGGASNGSTAADGAPDTSSGSSAVWTFTVLDGNIEGTWHTVEIQHPNGTTLREGGCFQDGTSCGDKGTGEEWIYEYTFTVN